jgi:hypothetical protein
LCSRTSHWRRNQVPAYHRAAADTCQKQHEHSRSRDGIRRHRVFHFRSQGESNLSAQSEHNESNGVKEGGPSGPQIATLQSPSFSSRAGLQTVGPLSGVDLSCNPNQPVTIWTIDVKFNLDGGNPSRTGKYPFVLGHTGRGVSPNGFNASGVWFRGHCDCGVPRDPDNQRRFVFFKCASTASDSCPILLQPRRGPQVTIQHTKSQEVPLRSVRFSLALTANRVVRHLEVTHSSILGYRSEQCLESAGWLHTMSLVRSHCRRPPWA